MTIEEKGVFIQIKNTIVGSKALVLVNCLNSFVHYCWFKLVDKMCIGHERIM